MTLHWNEPPPILTGSLQRNITQYAVTLTRQDSRDSQVVFVLAEADAAYIFTDLRPGTTYIIKVNVIIDTATKGQGELTYDLGIPTLTITTGEYATLFVNTSAAGDVGLLKLNLNQKWFKTVQQHKTFSVLNWIATD